MKSEAFKIHAQVEEDHWWFKARREIIKSLISSIKMKDYPKILEVGSGTGGNLKMLSQFGHVISVEKDELAIKISKEKTNNNIDIRQGSLPDNLPIFEHNFDLVCLFDVIEHIEEDKKSLEIIYSLLNPNGFLFITVPAHKWLWSGIDELVEHVRRYSKFELQEKINNSGFDLVKISFFNFFLSPLAILVRIFDKNFQREASGLNTPFSLLNKFLFYIFLSEKWLLRRIGLPFGISLMCIAKKSLRSLQQ